MTRTAQRLGISVLLLFIACRNARAADPPFEFKDGDRIAFIGNDFVERDLDRAYIETQLLTRFSDQHLTFRNLGYAGDTVRADARNLCSGWAAFGPPEQGFDRLKLLVAHLQPTVVMVAYGMNESFDGEKGLSAFRRDLSRLLDMLSEGKPRIVLISPIRHEDLGRPLPDPAEHNQQLGLYVAAIASEATRRGVAFIDLYTALGDGAKATPPAPLTRDGVHLNPYGYWRAASAVEQGLGYPPRVWQVELGADGKPGAVHGTRIDVQPATGAVVRFQATDSLLPVSPPPSGAVAANQRTLKVTGLKPGNYVLKSGDIVLATASAAQWGAGVAIKGGPVDQQLDQLRQVIRQKDQDFFNYWRPENDTYIFGYRNHEQGRNAVEIPRFEPLVAANDEQTHKLVVPQPVEYALTAEK